MRTIFKPSCLSCSGFRRFWPFSSVDGHLVMFGVGKSSEKLIWDNAWSTRIKNKMEWKQYGMLLLRIPIACWPRVPELPLDSTTAKPVVWDMNVREGLIKTIIRTHQSASALRDMSVPERESCSTSIPTGNHHHVTSHHYDQNDGYDDWNFYGWWISCSVAFDGQIHNGLERTEANARPRANEIKRVDMPKNNNELHWI
jgi:hypothetical protein